MKIEYKFIRVIVCMFSSFPFLFFAYGLIRMEYTEYFLYGNTENAVITNIDIEIGPSSGEYGNDIIYSVMITSGSNFGSKSKVTVHRNIGVKNNDTESYLVENAKVGDTLSVKVLSNHSAKVLNYDGYVINESFNFWGKILRWLVIFLLSVIGLFLLHNVYKTIKTKTTYN